MPGHRRFRWYFPWVPLALGAASIGALGALLLMPPIPEAQAVPNLVKAHETALTTGLEFFAGSRAGLRCEVHSVQSLTRTVPLPGADVKVTLRGKDGKVFPVFSGKTGADGVASVQFTVPDVAPGSYQLEVATRSALGEEKLQREVRVKTAPKVLLVTDKPLYQPGQTMHLRALALQAFNLTPVAGSPLVFEVEDGKGNKVFKQKRQTSAYGVASADFRLADEVNNGEYHVRALLGEHQADKTVTVKPYVLPRFKSDLKADKKFYLPKETVHADLQADYFFGKPVAGARVKVTASTFDVAFKDFQTWEGKTDAQGHVRFDVQLPDYFVGQPLAKGNALVRLEARVTDTADHTETISHTYPVSAQPIQVSLIPEGGRLVPGLENRVFVAALYPDGSPAQCSMRVWTGPQARGKPLAEMKTSAAGLAEFRLTPRAEQFRQGGWGQRSVEMVGGQMVIAGGPNSLFDLTAAARDQQGNTAQTTATLTSEPFGENVLLRLDRAIYKGGETLKVDIRSSAGLPTVYLDVVKEGQTLLTHWLEVKDGQARYQLDLPASAFGTLEVHAYQELKSGEVIRDSRVVYVNPPSDLKIDVRADRKVYLPGAEGKITFHVTDARGKPTAAALGILIVDEAVYALQEMQPGLEKVYFTLQEQLLKPQAQVVYKPSERLDTLVRQPVLDNDQQQSAQVLLTGIRPKPPTRWEVNPSAQRRQNAEGQLQQVGWALYQYAIQNNPFLVRDGKGKESRFRSGLLQDLVKAGLLPAATLTDPVGGKLTLDELARLEQGFTADRLATALTQFRMQQLSGALINYSTVPPELDRWFKDGRWTFPADVLAEVVRKQGLQKSWLEDAWGHSIRLVKLSKKRVNPGGQSQFDYHELVSAGPDGKLGTADDVKMPEGNLWQLGSAWWLDESRRIVQGPWGQRQLHFGLQLERTQFRARGWGGGMMGGFGGSPAAGPGMAGMGGGGGFAPPMAMMPATRQLAVIPARMAPQEGKGGGAAGGQSAAPARLREYFPETLFWQPELITDDKGVAQLSDFRFADSITTWRLTASASSRGGLLGGVTAPLRVFQDFFVDLDLPVALTQNDEVAFPVAVYNYLKSPQKVTLDLQPEPWFELADGQGLTRTIDLQANEVTSVKFRIRARRIGHFPLTVQARGSKTSDSVKRSVEVVPDGKKVEQVVTDRLQGAVTQAVTISPGAIPGSSKLLVKVYPGVFSQVLEGTEGMLRLPGG